MLAATGEDVPPNPLLMNKEAKFKVIKPVTKPKTGVPVIYGQSGLRKLRDFEENKTNKEGDLLSNRMKGVTKDFTVSI